MIAWDQVEELREAVGAEEFGELVDVFLEEVEGALAMLSPTADATTLEAQLHFLKGSALNLGFAEFSALCQAGESAARAGNTAAIDLTEIARSYHATKAFFLSEIATRYAA
ncbi:histidine kinase [Pseudaestuariivita atlantica]|uniref:Histidine kinase n=2 Tax=Pseudaestuariivita atlantica TaxID=1317121 RepID=A0A0L1JQ84_9RHOB|nr:Hpt domain-containing protein [Pseudaestuariivita atlantica]KNG93906.1 histidine kinase [Pseudaestuariivita atlantica]